MASSKNEDGEELLRNSTLVDSAVSQNSAAEFHMCQRQTGIPSLDLLGIGMRPFRSDHGSARLCWAQENAEQVTPYPRRSRTTLLHRKYFETVSAVSARSVNSVLSIFLPTQITPERFTIISGTPTLGGRQSAEPV